ncbi:RNA polymerase sigma-70 factor [Paenibacillus thermotolerans]|uniref:RNA polymerase sigma-70 factor n=1 Tax=Paenibacillus thermotolerans TaxID=3027807 RepID=UPI002367E12D|nr:MULTISPECIES: RNA polymerase sigma-70 factor [unclassified Paenibacillus]
MATLEELYQTHKRFLSALAYRMVSSVMDAEDIVHNVFLSLDADTVRQLHNPKAYLCRLVTNRCIDQLRSARVRREAYVGPWLPEPWIEPYRHDNGSADDPLRRAVMNETLSTAFLLLLETLSPVERAVYVLREAYDLNYDEIAETTGKSSAGCRQLYRRAKRKVEAARGGTDAETAGVPPLETTKAGALVERFIQALSTGNVELLSSLLTAGVTSVTDGGGKVQAAIRPVIGRDRVVAFLTGIVKKAPENMQVQPCIVNGLPGLVAYAGDMMINAISFNFQEESIGDIYIVSNPDKLRTASIQFQ